MEKKDKILVTGAAGLVGQNLVTELIKQGYTNIFAMDNHKGNLEILQKVHPQIQCIHADLSRPGSWEKSFIGAKRLFLLQAQITGTSFNKFQRNTIDATENVIRVSEDNLIPFTIFVGSSVVKSSADDNYTRSKKAQETLIKTSQLAHCIARPTLMFGWFDPKHLGWLSRLMGKVPFFPIPGHGRYVRQPLYVRDFCRVLIWCAEHTPKGKIYDIVGEEEVTYIDIIRNIKRVKKLSTLIIPIPVQLFRVLMQIYALFSKNPPFVADQLDALMAGDYFIGDPIFETFGFSPTPFTEAIDETFTHPTYSNIILERWT